MVLQLNTCASVLAGKRDKRDSMREHHHLCSRAGKRFRKSSLRPSTRRSRRRSWTGRRQLSSRDGLTPSRWLCAKKRRLLQQQAPERDRKHAVQRIAMILKTDTLTRRSSGMLSPLIRSEVILKRNSQSIDQT